MKKHRLHILIPLTVIIILNVACSKTNDDNLSNKKDEIRGAPGYSSGSSQDAGSMENVLTENRRLVFRNEKQRELLKAYKDKITSLENQIKNQE